MLPIHVDYYITGKLFYSTSRLILQVEYYTADRLLQYR